MRVDYLTVTAHGNLLRDKDPVLLVSGTEQEFELAADDRELEKRLLEVAEQGAEAATVEGRVDGWNGRFPVVLRTLAKRYGTDGKTPILLVITNLETSDVLIATYRLSVGSKAFRTIPVSWHHRVRKLVQRRDDNRRN